MSKGIYTYYDSEKGKIVYVGRDSNINMNKRHKAHLRTKGKRRTPFDRILQANPNRYYYGVLLEEEDLDNEVLNALERYYINIYNTFEDGFNFTEGGDKDYTVSEETRAKQSEAKKGKYVGEKNPFYGKHHTLEARAKQSENNAKYWLGKTRPKETKDKISKSNKGKTRSAETKAKLSEINTGKILSQETKDKIGKGNKGKIISQETKDKISEKQRYKLPIIRKSNKQNMWLCYPSYKDNFLGKNRQKCIKRKSLTKCITKVDEFLNSEKNNLGLIIPIIEIDIKEEL